MRYYVRLRGKDDVIGPFSVEEIMRRVRAGQFNPWDMVLADSGQTAEQLMSHLDFKWEALEGLFSAARTVQRGTPSPANTAAEEHRRMRDERKISANRMMLIGALVCIGGAVLTVVTYSAASESPTGGSFVIAWGPMIYGFIHFLRGLSAR